MRYWISITLVLDLSAAENYVLQFSLDIFLRLNKPFPYIVKTSKKVCLPWKTPLGKSPKALLFTVCWRILFCFVLFSRKRKLSINFSSSPSTSERAFSCFVFNPAGSLHKVLSFSLSHRIPLHVARNAKKIFLQSVAKAAFSVADYRMIRFSLKLCCVLSRVSNISVHCLSLLKV